MQSVVLKQLKVERFLALFVINIRNCWRHVSV